MAARFFKDKNIYLLTILIFVLKLSFSFFPSFGIDMGTWLAWGQRLGELGPANFYSSQVWTHYTPGFLYWLLVGNKLGVLNEPFIKVPTILADIGAGLIIFSLVKKAWSEKAALVSFLLYTLNPGIIFNGSVWGQIDGIFTLFLLLAVYFLVEKQKIFFSSLFWTVAFLVKPQAIALVPPLIWMLLTKFSLRNTLKYFAISILLVFMGSLPFFPEDILGFPKLVYLMSQDYPYTSLFAYNFWGIVGLWLDDGQKVLGTTLAGWGIALYILAVLGSFVATLKTNKKWSVYLFCALSLFAFFLFPTRVHERYLFPVFPFLLTSAFVARSRNLILFYIVLSIIHFLNLYYPYAYYQLGNLTTNSLGTFVGGIQKYLSAGTLIIFFAMMLSRQIPDLAMILKIKFMGRGLAGQTKAIHVKNAQRYLFSILVFAAITRLLWLWSPQEFYFDEVYHAFTAREIVRGNPAAWEFLAKPPQGFAYEWTHPPLAKLFMAGGILLFGEHPFSWRLPGAIVGVLCVYVIFRLAREIFKNERTALLSAFLFSLDGMPLVMSRVGMNDIYFSFFALGAILFFLKDRLFLSALFLGLAFASKWTAVFVFLVLGICWVLFKRRVQIGYLCFLILPAILYFASYIIFFTSGHSLLDWWQTQQQMWWYHTGLVATHPFSSAWWSWPLMLKPVWLYVKEGPYSQENIYIAGNPILFIFGLVSVLSGFAVSITKGNKGFLFIVLAYASFFLPWAFSPRIMFLYHYLPAVPFMIIALSWFLNLLWDKGQKKLVKVFLLVVVFTFVFYFPLWIGLPIPSWWTQFRF